MVNLTKLLKEGELRWIGKNYPGLYPKNLPIASKGLNDFSEVTGFRVYKFGRFKTENAIILHGGRKYFYAYVNPTYKGYRGFFKKLIHTTQQEFDVDHVLSRNLAKKLEYKYVLLSIIPCKVNRKHGNFEKKILNIPSPNICFADERIYNKVLSRNPLARLDDSDFKKGFNPNQKPKYGLTLKQAGLWSSAFGLHLINAETTKHRLKPLW
ncbi:hypothetical protein [uncultured Desulfobacter sp.]|uniref:hypothetical protein n=1 Tax=uncultured Desulfobacter sp. TaxID=240139 RepID=UPI002AAB8DFC|nr:hypothetical protein [uncultured Desulfobacter sp.]